MISKLPTRQYQFGIVAVFCLVALRLAVGWHFYTDGKKKLVPDFRSTWFLQQATGPFAERFLDLIPDRFGLDRLDREQVTKPWSDFRDQAAKRLQFDDQQEKQADQVLTTYERRLDQFLRDQRDELQQHRLEVRRLEQARQNPSANVESNRDWIHSRDLKLQREATPWIAAVSALQESFQDDMTALGKDEASQTQVPRLPSLTGKTWVDHAVTWLTLGVGICLLLGFMTRIAAIAGAGFLGTVLLTQPFLVNGANLTMFPYQLVELCALLFLAAVAAGRYAGLDFVWWALRNRRSTVD